MDDGNRRLLEVLAQRAECRLASPELLRQRIDQHVPGGDEVEIAIAANEEPGSAPSLCTHLHGVGEVVLGQVGLGACCRRQWEHRKHGRCWDHRNPWCRAGQLTTKT